VVAVAVAFAVAVAVATAVGVDGAGAADFFWGLLVSLPLFFVSAGAVASTWLERFALSTWKRMWSVSAWGSVEACQPPGRFAVSTGACHSSQVAIFEDGCQLHSLPVVPLWRYEVQAAGDFSWSGRQTRLR